MNDQKKNFHELKVALSKQLFEQMDECLDQLGNTDILNQERLDELRHVNIRKSTSSKEVDGEKSRDY